MRRALKALTLLVVLCARCATVSLQMHTPIDEMSVLPQALNAMHDLQDTVDSVRKLL